MGIKDLFDKGHSLKFVKNKTQDDFTENIESHRYIDAYSERRNRFLPDSDFTTASNFSFPKKLSMKSLSAISPCIK